MFFINYFLKTQGNVLLLVVQLKTVSQIVYSECFSIFFIGIIIIIYLRMIENITPRYIYVYPNCTRFDLSNTMISRLDFTAPSIIEP